MFGTYLQWAMNVEGYFAFTSQFPEEADKVILDMMYAGDWYSAGYFSDFLPQVFVNGQPSSVQRNGYEQALHDVFCGSEKYTLECRI